MRNRFTTKIYLHKHDPNHPLARKNGRVAVHRLVAQQSLGVDLTTAKLYVHHKDDNPLNNAPDNLEALSPRDHCRIHNGWKLIDGCWWKTCPTCKLFLAVEGNFYRRSPRVNGEFESKCKDCLRAKGNLRSAQKRAAMPRQNTRSLNSLKIDA